MDSVFIKVPVGKILPNEYRMVITNVGEAYIGENGIWIGNYGELQAKVYWWLEEINLPTEEEIVKESDKHWARSHFKAGANFILNNINKGG